MACYILELWLHAEMLKLENVSTELWSESWGKNYLLCGCAQLSSRVRSAFAEVQQSFYWSNLNIMVACSREIHLIFQIFSTRKKYINVIKDQNDLYIFYLIHFHHFYWGHLSIFVVSKICILNGNQNLDRWIQRSFNSFSLHSCINYGSIL